MATKADKNALSGQLSGAGFSFPFDISPFIDRALRAGVSDPFSYAYSLIIGSKVFKNHYQGIFRKNGTLKMTPAAYEAYVDSTKAAARSAGFTVSRKQIGGLIGKNVSPDEYAKRIELASEVRAHRGIITTLNGILERQGEKPMKNAEDVFDFFVGASSARVYDLYERASLVAAAEKEGLDLGRKLARQLARRTTGIVDFDEASKRFGLLAEEARLADVELQAAGYDTKELTKAMFGVGKEAGEDRRGIERVLNQREAQLNTQQATQRVSLDEQGRPVTGTRQQAGY